MIDEKARDVRRCKHTVVTSWSRVPKVGEMGEASEPCRRHGAEACTVVMKGCTVSWQMQSTIGNTDFYMSYLGTGRHVYVQPPSTQHRDRYGGVSIRLERSEDRLRERGGWEEKKAWTVRYVVWFSWRFRPFSSPVAIYVTHTPLWPCHHQGRGDDRKCVLTASDSSLWLWTISRPGTRLTSVTSSSHCWRRNKQRPLGIDAERWHAMVFELGLLSTVQVNFSTAHFTTGLDSCVR